MASLGPARATEVSLLPLLASSVSRPATGTGAQQRPLSAFLSQTLSKLEKDSARAEAGGVGETTLAQEGEKTMALRALGAAAGKFSSSFASTPLSAIASPRAVRRPHPEVVSARGALRPLTEQFPGPPGGVVPLALSAVADSTTPGSTRPGTCATASRPGTTSHGVRRPSQTCPELPQEDPGTCQLRGHELLPFLDSSLELPFAGPTLADAFPRPHKAGAEAASRRMAASQSQQRVAQQRQRRESHSASSRECSRVGKDASSCPLTSGRSWITADIERWRQVVRQELEECVDEVKVALNEAHVARMIAQFDEWRQQEESETSRLRTHLEELLKLNQSLRQNQIDWFMARGVHELIEKVAEGTASHCQAGMHQAINNCCSRVEILCDQVTGLQGGIEKLEQTTASQETKMNVLPTMETKFNSAIGEISGVVEQVSREHAEASRKLMKQHTLDTLSENKSSSDALLERFQRLHATTQQSYEETQTKIENSATTTTATTRQGIDDVSERLRQSDARFAEAMQSFREEGQRLREEVRVWRSKFDGASSEVVDWRGQTEESKHEVGRLNRESQEAEETISRLQIRLEKASAASALELIRDIKALEENGNIKVDLNNGDVEILRPLDFVPRKEKEAPTAEFVDSLIAGKIVDDLAQLEMMFNVPMVIEGHTGGSSGTFWQKVATNRAELILKHLATRGIEKRLMSAKGLPGEMGVGRACVLVRLDIFPDND